VSSFSGQERTHGKMRDGGSSCLRRRAYRISTTSWDPNPPVREAALKGKPSVSVKASPWGPPCPR
jgi:hypothetical protein